MVRSAPDRLGPPLVSVVVPTHDHGPTLGPAVRSALRQTVDELEVLIVGDGMPAAAGEIARGLLRLGAGDREPLRALERRRAVMSGLVGSGRRAPTRALVVPHASESLTVIEIRTHDRPGLLHQVGMTFARAGLTVHSAHIATYAGQTLDTFYLSEFGGRTLSPARVAQTISMLIDACDEAPLSGR